MYGRTRSDVVIGHVLALGTHQHLTGVNSHPNSDVCVNALHESRYVNRRETGGDRMVFVGNRGSEQRHDAVALHLIDHPAVPMDPFAHCFDNRGQKLQRPFRVEFLYQRGAPHDVREQDGDHFLSAGYTSATSAGPSIGSPQVEQNLCDGPTSARHDSQIRWSGLPQVPQNRAEFDDAPPHDGHITVPLSQRLSMCGVSPSRSRELVVRRLIGATVSPSQGRHLAQCSSMRRTTKAHREMPCAQLVLGGGRRQGRHPAGESAQSLCDTPLGGC